MNALPPADADPRAEVLRLRARTAELEVALTRAQDALHDREGQLQLALDVVGLGTWRYAAASQVVTLDPQAAAHYGVMGPALPAPVLRSLVHPEDVAHVTQAMRAVLDPAGTGRLAIEHRVIHPDGTVRWLAVFMRAVFAGEGADRHPTSGYGTTQDITRRKADEAALQAARAAAEASAREASAHAARLESLLTYAPIGIALLDSELRYQHINATLAAVNQLEPAAHLGRTIREVIPTRADALEACYAQVLATGAPLLDVELVGGLLPNTETRRIWQTSYFPVRDADDGIIGVGAIALEITARRQAEQALQMERRQLESILETMEEGVLAFRPDGAIVVINAMTRRLVQIAPEARISTVAEALAAREVTPLTSDGRPLPREETPIQRVLRGERFHDLEARVGRTDAAEESWLAFSGNPVFDEDGQITLAVLTARDITAQKRADAALRASAQNLASVIESIDERIWSIDRAGGLIVGNAIFHRDIQAFIGREIQPGESLWSLPLPEGWQARWRAEYERALAGESFSVERQRDGITLEYRFTPIRTQEGSVRGVTVFGRDITERLRADQARGELERKLGTLFALLPVGISIFDATGAIVYVNPAMEQLAEIDHATMRAGAPQRLRYLRPDGTPRPAEELAGARAFREHQPVVDVETGIVTEAGSMVWVSASAVPVDFPDWRVVVVTTDITQRKQADAALRASELRYRILFETMAQGVVYQTADGQIIAANPAAEHILGLTLDQLQGRTSHDPRWQATHTDGAPFLGDEHPAMVALRTGQEVREVVMGFYHPGQEAYRWISIQAVPMFPPGEATPTQVYTIFADITERRAAQRALEEERQQLTVILDTMYEGVMAIHPDGTLALINPAAMRLRDLDPAHPPTKLVDLRQTPHQLLDAHGQPFAPEERPLQRVMRGERFAGLEVCQRSTGDGAERWFLMNGTPIDDADGRLRLGVITFQDITERQRAEEAVRTHAEALSRTNAELTRSLRLKDEFLAMMSHELRTPLNVILGYVENLVEEAYGPLIDRQRRALATVTASGRQLLGILSDILDLAHLEGGRAVMETTRIAIDSLCRAATQLVAPAAQQKGIALSRAVAVEVEAVRGDERRLTQILTNLLDNAVKFTPSGGRVGLEVTANADQEQIAFTVWDTGIGIATADYDRLFQPFTQLDGRLAREYGGVGLGLSLVRRLVDLHGGSIQLESTPGQGSRFTVSLPWAAEDNVAPPAPHLSAHPAPVWATPPRVVIADDHEVTLDFYRDRLEQEGCAVAVARTGVEAVAQVRAVRPDVAILDIQMPELDGLSAIRQIRADPELRETPIIALTALAMPGDRERCLDAGSDVYLAKPVSMRTLMASIVEVLAHADASPAPF